MASRINQWLIVYATRKKPSRAGVSVITVQPGQKMRAALNNAIKERNMKEVRSRNDWYCLCIVHGFHSRFGPTMLRKELVSVSVPGSFGAERSVLMKLERVLHKNKVKCHQVQLVF